MLDRNWYSNLREINPVSRGDYLQTENIVNSIARQNHKNDVLHQECLRKSTNQILDQLKVCNR